MVLGGDFLDEFGNWECIRCAACCSDVRAILPHLATKAGTCKYLIIDLENDTSYCKIYEDRPEVCRFKKMGMTDKQLADTCATILNNTLGDS